MTYFVRCGPYPRVSLCWEDFTRVSELTTVVRVYGRITGRHWSSYASMECLCLPAATEHRSGLAESNGPADASAVVAFDAPVHRERWCRDGSNGTDAICNSQEEDEFARRWGRSSVGTIDARQNNRSPARNGRSFPFHTMIRSDLFYRKIGESGISHE